MKNIWIFVWLTGVVVGIAWIYPTWWSVSLLGIWIIRLYHFKHQQMLLLAGSFALSMIVLLCYRQQTESRITPVDNQEITLYADTITINGNHLKGKGVIKGEIVSVYYTLKNQEEQIFWLKNTCDVTLRASLRYETYPKARNFYQFDYRNYMQQQEQSYWQVSLGTYQIIGKQQNWRKMLRHYVTQGLPPYLTQFIDSLFFGTDTFLSDTMQELGWFYLVHLSGAHITWLLKHLTILLQRLGLTREKTIWILRFLAIFLWYICRNNVGVQKTILLFLIPKGTRLDKIAWAGMFLMLLNPYLLLQLGFQFSFGLSFLAYFFAKQPFTLWLFTLPLFSMHFFEFSFLSLLAIIPLSSIVMPVVCGVILLARCSPLCDSLVLMVEQACVELVNFGQFLATQHWLKHVSGKLPDEKYLLIFSCIFIFAVLKKSKWGQWRYLCLCLMMYLFLPVYYEQIVMIDVGQGSSLLIQKGEHALLIDTGGVLTLSSKEAWKQGKGKNIAKDVLVPSLKSFGINRLESVIITHADADHVQALADLKRAMPIQDIYYGLGAKISGNRPILAPYTIRLATVSLHILAPFQTGSGENDDSLMIYTQFGHLKWLITGDASQKVERLLMKNYPHLKVDALIVGHHGSRYSTDASVVKQLAVQYSLISVGQKNRYGHPHQEVLERLKQTVIYRTDQMGAIRYMLKNKKWEWEKNLP